MLVVSTAGAVMMVFMDEQDLASTVQQLQGMLAHHRDKKLAYPATYGMSSMDPVQVQDLNSMCHEASKMVGGSGFMPSKPQAATPKPPLALVLEHQEPPKA